MSARFRFARAKLLPPRFVVGEGGLVGYALDLVKDAFVERLRLGGLARLPQNDPTGATTAPPDALAAMGRDRRVVRGLGETDAAYAVRLVAWLTDRKTAGNPYTLMRKLAEYVGPLVKFRTVDARGNWFTREANGTESMLLAQGNWNWDQAAPAEAWSRFWVILYPNGLWTAGDSMWGAPATQAWGETGPLSTWGSTMMPENATSLRFLVSDWKPAGTRCVNIILAFDPLSFNPAAPEPDGLWRRWSKTVGGVQVPARLATARYLDGV